MKRVDFCLDHLEKIRVQPGQMEEVRSGEIELLSKLDGISYSWVEGEKVLACGGIAEVGERDIAWMLVSNLGIRNFFRLHRDVSNIVDSHDGELETYVDWDFFNARRWVRFLGFKETDEYGFVNGVKYVRCVRWPE